MRLAMRTLAAVWLLGLGFVAGCATTGDDSMDNTNNTNHQYNNNNNTNPGTNCQATCTDPDKICVGGDLDHQTCAPKCGDNGCDNLMTCCFGGCVDLKSDPNNCGACGKYCGEEASCVNGLCVDACNNMCEAPQKCCGGTCVDVMSDFNNCGSCGKQCDATVSDSCTNGYCTCGISAECTGGFSCCPDRGCRNLQNDVQNCGQCGHECAQGEVCVNGQCQCGTSGQACQSGQACCNGECVDIQHDENNCGRCGNKCSDLVEGYTCNDGVCNCNGETCEPPPAQLGGGDAVCCGNGCVVWMITDLSQFVTGVKNCGSCGNDCPIGHACVMGQCQ